MKLSLALKIIIVAVFCVALQSCGALNKTVIHAIYDEEFKDLKAGESYTPKLDGYFISQEVFLAVTGAELEK